MDTDTASRSTFSLPIFAVFFSVQMLLLTPLAAEGVNSTQLLPATDLNLTAKSKPVTFDQVFTNLWASDHQGISEDQMCVNLSLDHNSGSGIISRRSYLYGFFSVAIKIPGNNSAGVATTFYTSNAEVYQRTHDEIDFEFLGVVPGEQYVMQTNIYGNGSTNMGREQRFHLWFDPTADFHRYSLLWTPNYTTFFVDNMPVRQHRKTEEPGAQYPSKPMSVYATIWDASSWATDGGRYRTNYSNAPFVATYRDFVLNTCNSMETATTTTMTQPIDCPSDNDTAERFSKAFPLELTSRQRKAMEWVRRKYMFYDYCADFRRYPKPLPECMNGGNLYHHW